MKYLIIAAIVSIVCGIDLPTRTSLPQAHQESYRIDQLRH